MVLVTKTEGRRWGGGGYRGHGRGVGTVVTKTEGRGGGAIGDTVGECRHGDETARSGANLS